MFRDASWWVCSFFIGVFGYMFGTLAGFPTWSATDTKLSVFSNMATGIAGIATAFAAFYAYRSFQSWEERTKKQHRLEHKTASIKELSLCYEMYFSDLTVYLMELQAWNKRIRQTTINDYKFDKETEAVKRKLEKVHENRARYKSSLDFTQSFYKDKILQQHQPQSIVTLQSELCDLASNGDPWSDKLDSYAKQGADSILALYENKN